LAWLVKSNARMVLPPAKLGKTSGEESWIMDEQRSSKIRLPNT